MDGGAAGSGTCGRMPRGPCTACPPRLAPPTALPPLQARLTHDLMQVIARLKGEMPLPWEGELTAAVVRHLGTFRGPVLQLLHRDPAHRISMRRFHIACTKLFAARTTVEA